MVKPQTVRSIYKLVASMSSLMKCFSAIAGSIREKNKNGYYKAPLNGYLNEMRFCATGGKRFYQPTSKV